MGTWSTTVSGVVIKSNESLDEALEQAVLALESDEPLDRERLLATFPQWVDDLNQFIDNWLGMEHRTALLAESQAIDYDSPSEDLNGKIIGDYELLEFISAGGMGVVYRARQISLGRIVALKMVVNAVRDKTRFRIEAESAASLHHTNIVTIHEVGEFEGQPFLSMQYIAGGNLHDHLAAGPMAPRAAASLVRTIATAVHYAHQRGILHRDLKPANVLLDEERRPFVSDFGLAKQMGNSIELTRSGAIIGTPGYMAPEQAMGQVKSITVAADVYGLGAILYATLTGDAPFKTDSDLLTLRKVIDEPPVSPRSKRPDLDRNLETICLKCLEKAPASRYGSARQLADDLTRYLQGEPVNARPIGYLERRWRWCARNPALAILSFFAGLMLAAVVSLSLGFAWREYVGRMNAEFAVLREASMAEAVDLARVDAESKSKEALEAMSDLYTTNGLWAARTDQHGESLLWFAQAARLKGITDSFVDDSKTRCLSWISQAPTPIAALQLPAPMQPLTFQADWANWHLSPTLPEMMYKSGDDFGIWNFRNEEIWRPTSQKLFVNSADWSKDGTLLALAGANGEIRLLDAATKASKASAFFDSPVSFIAFSSLGNKLIVCMSNRLAILNSRNLNVECEWTVESPCVRSRFSSDDSKILAMTNDGLVRVYHIAQATPTLMMQTKCLVSTKSPFAQAFVPEFSEDGMKLFVRNEERRLRILDTSDGKQLGPTMVTGSSHCVALSPDQGHCASGGDGYARVQAIRWTKGIPSFVRHESRLSHDDAVNNIVFGGKQFIATAGRDRVVQLWRVGEVKPPGGLLNERALPLASLTHTGDVLGMLFANNGSQLVTLQCDGVVRVWQIPSFEPPGYIAHGTRGGTTAKTVGDDRWLIAGSTHWGSNVVNASLRRLKDGLVVAETPLNGLSERGHLLDAHITMDQHKLISLHASPARSGKTMIAPDGTAGSVQVWEFPTCRPIGPPISLAAEPRSVGLHPSGTFAAVLLVNMDIALVDLVKPGILSTLISTQSSLPLDADTGIKPSYLHNGQLQFSEDGNFLYAWGIGNGFSVWDWQQAKLKYSTEFAKDWRVNHLAASSTSKRLAVADHQTNRVAIVDDVDGRIIRELDHVAKIRSVEFSRSGKEILTACEDGRARIVDVLNDDSKGYDLVHNKLLLDAHFSPDGLSIATLTSEMRVYLWRIRDRQWAINPLPVPKGTQELLFSPDSQCIITMGFGYDLKVLDLSSFNGKRDLDLNYVTSLGELLSAKSIGNGGIVNLTTAEWLDRWRMHKNAIEK